MDPKNPPHTCTRKPHAHYGHLAPSILFVTWLTILLILQVKDVVIPHLPVLVDKFTFVSNLRLLAIKPSPWPRGCGNLCPNAVSLKHSRHLHESPNRKLDVITKRKLDGNQIRIFLCDEQNKTKKHTYSHLLKPKNFVISMLKIRFLRPA